MLSRFTALDAESLRNATSLDVRQSDGDISRLRDVANPGKTGVLQLLIAPHRLA